MIYTAYRESAFADSKDAPSSVGALETLMIDRGFAPVDGVIGEYADLDAAKAALSSFGSAVTFDGSTIRAEWASLEDENGDVIAISDEQQINRKLAAIRAWVRGEIDRDLDRWAEAHGDVFAKSTLSIDYLEVHAEMEPPRDFRIKFNSRNAYVGLEELDDL